VIDLLMETHHGAAIIKLQNAAGPGVVGPKAEHRHQMAGGPCAVSRDQSADVEVGEIVGMSQQERLTLKPFSIRKHGPAGPEQFLLVHQIDSRRPARRPHVGVHLSRQPMGIDEYALDPGFEQQL
jgi:hypothetical protein